MSGPVAVYVHTPFCPSKCGYCDFNSYAMTGDVIKRTVRAISRQIRESPWSGRPAKTIFFGGGTPTFLDQEDLCGLLKDVIAVHPPVSGCEVTSEANPGTVDSGKFAAMREAGFNRLSLGAQSFDTSDLIRLGRVHGPTEIGRAVGLARRAGFDNVSLDLMFALPGQTLRAWENNLCLAFQMQPDHLSLYGLTLEANTRFYRYDIRGLLDIPDEDRQVKMYDMAIQMCNDAGLSQYEISNFSKPGRESLHNLAYWRSEEYLAYGPGAVGFVGGTRFTHLKHPERFSSAVEGGAGTWCENESPDGETRNLERIMMGIRLNEGLDMSEAALDPKGVEESVVNGWLDVRDGRATLTGPGRHFCSRVALLLAPGE